MDEEFPLEIALVFVLGFCYASLGLERVKDPFNQIEFSVVGLYDDDFCSLLTMMNLGLDILIMLIYIFWSCLMACNFFTVVKGTSQVKLDRIISLTLKFLSSIIFQATNVIKLMVMMRN